MYGCNRMPMPIEQIVSPSTFVHSNASHINSVVQSLHFDWRSWKRWPTRVVGAVVEYSLHRVSMKLCHAHGVVAAERLN